MPDKVIHFEIPADNVERAQKFYAQAFGWQMNSMPGEGYTLVSTTPTDANGRPTEPGAINGGMLKRQEPIKNVVITVNVADIDDALDRIKKLGGTPIADKIKVADTGISAYFKDPEGNTIGVWQDAKKG